MFLTALSSKQGYVKKADDPKADDISPASFKVEFDEPIRIKNADVELVSCKVARDNTIVITENTNTLTVRMGEELVSDQYVARIPPGTYTTSQLADAIVRTLNDVMPLNAYRGWDGVVTTAGEIQLRYSIPGVPSANVFKELVKTQNITDDLGVRYPTWTDAAPANADFVQAVCEDEQQDLIASKLGTPEGFRTCAGIDVGEQSVRELSKGPEFVQRTGFSNYGVWEGERGNLSAIVRPVKCVTKSSFDVGYGGFSGTTAKPTYWTWEFDQNTNTDGDPIARYGSLFGSDVLDDSEPVSYSDDAGFPRQINGCLAHIQPKNDRRGAPYNSRKELHFPYARQGAATDRRKIAYKTTWTGQITLTGQANAVPDQYTLQMQTIAKRAFSVVQPSGFAGPENTYARISISPLITGLPQVNSSNELIDTSLNSTNILKQPPGFTPGFPKLVYKPGTIGQLNYRNGNGNPIPGNNFTSSLRTNTQGQQSPGDPYKTPYYKIVSVDSDGNPDEVVLVDSGEHAIPFDATSTATKKATWLYLNDPSTFERTPGLTNTQLMEQGAFRLEPTAVDIGAAEAIQEPSAAYRMPSFQLGIMRDMIYDQCIEQEPDANPFKYLKDLTINLETAMFKGSATIPDGTMYIKVGQFQPSLEHDQDYEIAAKKFSDDHKLLLRGYAHSWNSIAGTGPALNNWSSWVGPTNQNAAVLLQIFHKNVYSPILTASYTDSYSGSTTVWQGATVLAAVGTQRQGYATMNCYRKTRFFPLHPMASMMPCTIFEKCQHTLGSVGSAYAPSNYRKNLGNCASTARSPSINTPVTSTSAVDGSRPLIMLKTKNLTSDQISSSAVPASGATTTDLVLEGDFDPAALANMAYGGLPSVCYADIGPFPATSILLPLGTAPIGKPFLPTFSVEIHNLPCSGYLGKSFDNGNPLLKKGSGQRLPIVGIVPAKEFPASNEALVNYWYKTEYYQPVQVRLPTAQFFYHFDINLREILSGKLLTDLRQTSEVVFRIYPLPD